MSGTPSKSNKLHLHRPREPSRVHACECAPSAQRARGLFWRVSSRHGAAQKDARPPCLSLTRRITTVSHPCQRQRRAKRRAALNPRDPTSIQTPSTVKGRAQGSRAFVGGPALLSGCSAPALHRHALRPVVTGLPLRARAPSPSLPPPHRLGCEASAACGGKRPAPRVKLTPLRLTPCPSWHFRPSRRAAGD